MCRASPLATGPGYGARWQLVVAATAGLVVLRVLTRANSQALLTRCSQYAAYCSSFLISAVIWALDSFPFVSSFELGCHATFVVVC